MSREQILEYMAKVGSDGGRNRMPPILVIAELLLLIMVFRNIINFVIAVSPRDPSVMVVIVNLVSIGTNVVSTMLAVNGMIGISSSRPKSWRKIARSGISLLFLDVYYYVMSLVGFIPRTMVMNSPVIIILIIVVEIIVFLPSVRRYYTPPLFHVPPLKDWILFIGVRPLFSAESYRLAYPDDDEPSEKDPSSMF